MESINEKTLFEVAEIQLTYKSNVKASLRPKITSSRDAYGVLNKYWDDGKIDFVEQFKVLLLNRANKVMGIYEVSSGTTVDTVADPKSVFVAALKANACGVIVSHNHPSGNLMPSEADRKLTNDLKDAASSFTFHFSITSLSRAKPIIHLLMRGSCSPPIYTYV
jgi:DNA repair protein RadC